MELDSIPTLSSLIEGMNDRKAVKRVILKVSLAHSLVRLSRKSHEIAELAELLEDKILIGGLLKAHGLEDSLVCKLVC